MIKDILKYSVSSLWHRKTRSILSVLSILIGIMAIFALSSFGLGIKAFVEDYGKTAGTDKLMMMPKDYISAIGSSKSAFTEDEIDFVKKISGVDEAAGIIISNAKIKFRDYKEKYTFAFGMPTDAKESRLVGETFTISDTEKGRNLKEGDVLKIVLGYNYLMPEVIFKKPVSVGDKVLVNDIELQVVGFYTQIGNPQDDAQIYMPYEAAKKIFNKEVYEYIIIRSAAGQEPGQLADRINGRFRKQRNLEKGQEDFFIQTFEEVLSTYSSILNILIGVLVLIALISVIVAAVNIMNSMYTSILERTREIGVMKSIGAANHSILIIFMVESGLLGLIGGIFGIILGYFVARIGGYAATYYGISLLKPAFPLWLVIGCLSFAFFIGILSGFLPARQASQLNPVEALRYE